MAGFASYADMLTSIIDSGKIFEYNFYKTGVAADAVGRWTSYRYQPGLPISGSHPAVSPGTAYTNMSGTGSMIFPNVSPQQKYLLSWGAQSTFDTTLMLYDLLLGVADIRTDSVGVRAVNSGALPRYTSGLDVQAWIELQINQNGSANPQVGLHQYTNEKGDTNRSGSVITFPTNTADQRWASPLSLQSGDMGVRSVEALGISVPANLTAGAQINVLLIKPIAFLPLIANTWTERDFVLQSTAMPRIYDGACLNIMPLAVTTDALNFWGSIKIGYG